MADSRRRAQGGMHRFSTTPEQERFISEEARRARKPEHAVFREVVEAGFKAVSEKPGGPGRGAPGDGRQAHAAGLANLAQGAMSDYAVLYMLRRIMAALDQDPDDLAIRPLAVAGFIGGTECGTLIEVWDRAGESLADGDDAFRAISAACVDAGVSPGMLTGPARIAGAQGGNGNAGRKGGGDAKHKRKQKR